MRPSLGYSGTVSTATLPVTTPAMSAARRPRNSSTDRSAASLNESSLRVSRSWELRDVVGQVELLFCTAGSFRDTRGRDPDVRRRHGILRIRARKGGRDVRDVGRL